MHIKSQVFKGAVAAVVLAASQACLASVVTTLTLLPGSAGNVTGNAGTSAPGFGSGSWAAPGSGGKSEVYIVPSLLFSSPVTIGDISSISYWTNKGGLSTAVDWSLTLYTVPTGPGTGDSASWYRSRLTTEPYFTQSGSVTANTWHQWSTGNNADSLRFYDSPRSGTFGTYTDPFFADLSNGSHDYSTESILYFSLQTGSAWANGFAGLVDGLTVTRTNGDVGIVNFEATASPVPEPGSLALVGIAIFGLAAAGRRKQA